jgi:hypothetical protein
MTPHLIFLIFSHRFPSMRVLRLLETCKGGFVGGWVGNGVLDETVK